MNKHFNRTLLVLGGALAVLNANAATDDTELFFSKISQGELEGMTAEPNILFIIDSSSSMNGEVVTQEAWDPDTTFPGDFDSDAIYWSQTGSAPAAGSAQWFDKSALHCLSAIDGLRANGAYADNFAAWKATGTGTEQVEVWLELNDQYHTRPVECESDAGDHGEGVDGAEPSPSASYVANGSLGPWDATENFTWNDSYNIYDGNFLNHQATNGTITRTRLEVVQDVMTNMIASLTGVNIGLMHFNQLQGGTIAHEVAPVETNRATLLSTINSISEYPTDTTAGQYNWTPLSETMHEATRYFLGDTPHYGDCSNIASGECTDSVSNSRDGATYKSPISFSCQQNHIVLLTDGAPTKDQDANSLVAGQTGFEAATGQTACEGDNSGLGGSTNANDGICLEEQAAYLWNHDMSPLPLKQEVKTHTIGFGIDLGQLEAMAQLGGDGEYQLADDTTSLTLSLTEIVLGIFEGSTTFTAPSVPVNSFNRTQNLHEVYVSVFEPSNTMHWPGNLKKYKLQNGELVDNSGALAVDPVTGFFRSRDPKAQSIWSATADGDTVTNGGAAHRQPAWATDREVYTNLEGNGPVDLANGANAVTVASVSAAQLGIPGNDPAVHQEIVDWVNGKDSRDINDDTFTDDDRHQMGAPLHVRPVTFIYGGTADNPDGVVHTMTNDGYLHAISTRTGEEEWAFIPEHQLDRQYGLYDNQAVTSTSYGLDGDIVAYMQNDDYLPGIDTTSLVGKPAETAYLIFGQRRGGHHLTAMDVSTRGDPKLLWTIGPNSGGAAALGELGQTWSTPTIMKVSINGTTKHVAIIGGGYDDGQDQIGYRTDTYGKAIYMINIEDGTVEWSSGANPNVNHDLVMNMGSNLDVNATMKHSFAAPVQAIDVSGDGFVNRIYAADTGGRVWRFDVDNGAPRDELVDGGLLASLGAAETEALADARRFYARPDAVAMISENPDYRSYVSVNIGSGHRAHPLVEDNDDWFFAIRDFSVFDRIETDQYASMGYPLLFNDLVDITNDMEPALLDSDSGWRLKLENAGEKSFNQSLTFKGVTLFTTFSPVAPTSSCTGGDAGAGTNRIYMVRIENGAADTDKPATEIEKEDRYDDLQQGGIAPTPVLFFTDHDNDGDELPGEEGIEDGDTEISCHVGAESVACNFQDTYTPTYWFQDETR